MGKNIDQIDLINIFEGNIEPCKTKTNRDMAKKRKFYLAIS